MTLRRCFPVLILALWSGPARADECLVSSEVQRLAHYQAWSNRWLETEFSRKPETFHVLRTPGAVLAYSSGSNAVFVVRSGFVSHTSCGQSDYLKCLARLRGNQQPKTLTQMLLGGSGAAPPLDSSLVCTQEVAYPHGNLAWAPTPSVEARQQVLLALATELKAKLPAVVQKAVCNKFNVADPMIWAVVEAVGPAGERERWLVGFELRSGPDEPFAAIVRPLTKEYEPLASRILEDSIELPIRE